MEHTIKNLIDLFEGGQLTRRQLVQGLVLVTAAQGQPSGGALRPVRLDHVQIIVSDLARSQAFYAKLLGATERSRAENQVTVNIGGTAFISLNNSKNTKGVVDHFAVAVEDFAVDRASAAVERILPGSKIEKGTGDIYVTDPDGARVQIVPKE
jgi:catechol 2,3-dioxygenase-like lactoylglutathione lyase family enzyme